MSTDFSAAKKPYKWQLDALERFKNEPYFALDAACGCGKTLAAIMIAEAKEMPVIVIAPTHDLCSQWENNILKTDSSASVWVYDRREEAKNEEKYRSDFEAWLKW